MGGGGSLPFQCESRLDGQDVSCPHGKKRKMLATVRGASTKTKDAGLSPRRTRGVPTKRGKARRYKEMVSL